MTQPKPFDAFLVGEGSLLVRCGDALLRGGHRVRGVASPGGPPAEWAARHGIPHAPPGGDLAAPLRAAPCDYLFSIVNRRVLSADVYGLARRAAINFHDSPLPRYAGVHATSWAILHGERLHGVTWHLITDEVDAGDVLKQRLVEVDPRETALTLNAKCYDAALESFEELIGELAAGSCVPRRQDPAERSYFGLHARPRAACSLDWHRTAREIDSLVRALDFGGYTNPLGLPRLWIGGEALLVGRAQAAEAADGPAVPPGTVVALADEEMLVATATSPVRVGGFRAPDGREVRTPELVARFGLAPGARLPAPDPAEAERLDAAYGELCRHERFWVRRLAGAEPLALGQPAAEPGPRAGEGIPVPLDGEVPGLLASLEPAERLRWLTAACGCFLGRIAGAARFDVGLRRPLPGAARGLASVFAGTVPLRFELEPGQGFAGALAALRDRLRELEPRGTFARDLPLRHPELRRLEAQLPGGRWPVALAWEGAEGEAGPLELVLAAEPAAVRWTHDPRALAAAEVEGLAAQLGAFLRGIAGDPERPLAALPRVGPEERRRLVEEWSGSGPEAGAGRTLQDLLAEQAARTPDAVAVECGGERLRYAELEERANRLAHALRRAGAGPERVVGISLDGTTDAVVAMLGVLKAGGAYLPLDPAYPRERLAYMLEDSGAVALVTRTEHLAALPETAVPVLCLDRGVLERESPEPLSGQGSEENLAYVIYTSGSTGRPKGVPVPQRGVVSLAVSFREMLGLGPGDRLLLMVSLSFDASVGTIFSTLAGGGTLVLPRERAALGGAELLRFCEAHRITVVDMPAALWKHWLDAMEAEPGGPLLPDLRLVLAGGESVQTEQLRRWAERTGGRADFVGPYGPTEATVCTTLRRAAAAEAAGMPEGRLPIGRPVPGARVYVLDAELEPVPAGVPGELYVGGAGVTRGYHRRPGLSAERFLPDPFRPGGRMYRTGDGVRWLPGGELEFLGRTDHQVKVRGFRVELGEIEAALLAQDGVREAVVVVRGEGADQRLAAYVVGEGAADAARLRDAVRERLPEHMVPAAFVALETLPLTPNGKVDRAALPEPRWGSAAREHVAPRDETEERLCALWREVLAVERVGVHDSFFDLGGHSLTATQLISRVRESLGREITFRTLVQAPTVAELAVAVAASEGGEEPAIIGRDAAEQLLAGLDQLSEEEVERLLAGLAGDGG